MVTGATAGCTLEFTIEHYSESAFTWTTISQANVGTTYTFIESNVALDDSTTNTFNIQTDNAAWQDTTQSLRLRVRDPNSSLPGGNQVDAFKVIISGVCSAD